MRSRRLFLPNEKPVKVYVPKLRRRGWEWVSRRHRGWRHWLARFGLADLATPRPTEEYVFRALEARALVGEVETPLPLTPFELQLLRLSRIRPGDYAWIARHFEDLTAYQVRAILLDIAYALDAYYELRAWEMRNWLDKLEHSCDIRTDF